MNRDRKVMLLAVGAVAVSAILPCVFWSRGTEPAHEGRTLSSWMVQLERESDKRDYRTRRVPSAEAIRQMGNSAVPTFIEWLSYKTPPWKSALTRWLKQPRVLGPDVSMPSREAR